MNTKRVPPGQIPNQIKVTEYVREDSGIAAAYAGWLLAQLGAEVTRLVAEDIPEPNTASPLSVTKLALAKGKRSVEYGGDAAAFNEQLEIADIFLCDSPDALEKELESPDAFQARHPTLIISIASVFGLASPYAKFSATALDAQALSGVAWSLGSPERKPLSLPPGVIEHQAGVVLASSSLLALQVAEDCGRGRLVDISLADILASYIGGNSRLYIHHGLQWHRSGRRAPGSGGAYPYVILPCKDGEVCVFGRTPEEWQRLVAVMGNPAWASDPRYQDLRALGQQYPEEGDELIKPWLAKHTKAELEKIALENNLILSPVRDFADVLNTQQFDHRKFFHSMEITGKSVKVPNLPFKVTEARNDDAENIAHTLLAHKSIPFTHAPKACSPQPLSGIRVLDFGWVWSAPWVSTMLAELGAEVIKVEHAKRPDNLRLSGRVIRDGKKVDGPSKEMSPIYHQVNHGKLGITLNAKEPRAVELLKRLVAMSDIVVENMSPGTMERTHLGYDTLREVNPKIVMLSMSAAGQFGPQSNMRAYAPNMSSSSGLESLVGYRNESPIGALCFALGDPNASSHAVLAVLAALSRVRATGLGCHIDLAQIEALVGVLRPYLIDSQMNDQQSPTLGNAHPDFAPHGIYPAQEDDAWLSLAVTTESQWQALGNLAGKLAGNITSEVVGGEVQKLWGESNNFKDNGARLENLEALDSAIASWTGIQPRDELVQQLREAGIASSPVLSIQEQWEEPHYRARGIKHPVNIPVYGTEELFQAPWRFSDFNPKITEPGPSTGQHNHQVFSELLGLDDDEISALEKAGVIA